MRVGACVLPDLPWREARPVWAGLEALGFDHAWTYDHLTWRTLRDGPWFAAVPTLTAVASVTSRLRLGTLVASPNFRHPVTFAKELMTLDDVSDGRVTLGIGAGGTGFDATALGQAEWSRRERTERFEEFVTLTDLLLRQPATTRRGTYYSAIEARSVPGCVQRPRLPFAVAASGPRGLRLAARYGQAWVTFGDPGAGDDRTVDECLDAARRQVTQLAAACAAEGRDPSSIARLLLLGGGADDPMGSAERFRDVLGRATEAGLTDLVVQRPRPEPPYAGEAATFERVAAEVLGAHT